MNDITVARAALESWQSVVGTYEMEPLPQVTNPIWRVVAEDDRRYVFKMLPEYPPGVGPIEEFRVLGYLQGKGIPVAPPIVDDEGGIFTTRADRRYVLLPYLPHDKSNHELGPDASTTAYAIGAAIARIDQALAECPWRIQSFVDEPVREVLDEALPKLPESINRQVAPFVEQIRATASDLPMQRTVGDCSDNNTLVYDKQVSGFIDLDHLPIGPRVLDLSHYISSRISRHLADPETSDRTIPATLAVIGDYITGYHETYPLTEKELTAVVPLLLLLEVGLASWWVHGWVPNPEGYRHSEHVIDWLASHLTELTTAAGTPPMSG